MSVKKALGVILGCCYLVSCANSPIRSYKNETDQVLKNVRAGNIKNASNSLSNKEDVLFNLENGTLLRLTESYPSSINNFVMAQAWVNAWMASYHNGSLGSFADTSQAVLVNDKVVDYQVKDYEKVMIPTYQALNKISLNNWRDARVEVQRMYQLETVIRNYREQQYNKEQAEAQKNKINKSIPSLADVEKSNRGAYDFATINSPQVIALQNGYQNAFSHYLAGFVFQALGEDSLSRPGYINALKLTPNSNLVQDSIKNLDTGGAKKTAKTADVLIISELGNAPQFKSTTIHIPFVGNFSGGRSSCLINATIAFPSIVPDKFDNNLYVMQVDDKTIEPELFTDFNLMALRYLHDDIPNMFIRNVGRLAKDVASQQLACETGGSLLNMATTLTSLVLNDADERTWVMLPSKIYLSRVTLPFGKHQLKVYTVSGPKTLDINLTNSYHIIAYRQIGSHVYFSPQLNLFN